MDKNVYESCGYEICENCKHPDVFHNSGGKCNTTDCKCGRFIKQMKLDTFWSSETK